MTPTMVLSGGSLLDLCSVSDVGLTCNPLAGPQHLLTQHSDRSAPAVLGYGAALSVILAAFTYTGGRLSGYQRDPTVDEVSRKEYLRKNRRRPVDQIVNELGEGRGKIKAELYAAGTSRAWKLTCSQVSPRPAMNSAAPSASRRLTVSMCRSRHEQGTCNICTEYNGQTSMPVQAISP